MADEIGRALQRVGGTAGALNVNFEKLSSWIAIISSRTRESAESIGNSMKTILARMQNMVERGYDEESGDKVNNVAKALASINVQLMDSEGQFRNLGTVMDEVGSKWDSLDSRQKSYIATAMAGVRQQSRFYNLMEGYADSVELYEESLSAAGTANKKFEIWQESSQAKLEKFQSTLQTIYQSSFDSGLIKDVITFGTELLDTISKIQEEGHLLITTVGLLSTAFFMFNAKASKSFYAGLMGIFGAILKVDTSIKTMGMTMTLTEIATVKLSKAVNILNLAFQRFLPALILTGLVYAIQKIVELRKEAQETEKSFKESITAFSNNQNELENLKKLSQQYDELNSKVTKNAEEEQKLIDIKNNIGKACEELGVSYDTEGNAIINNSEQIRKYIELKEKQLDLDRKVINETYDTERNSDLNKVKSEQKAIKDLEAELKNVENSKSAYLKNGFNSESREIIALDKRIKELSKSLGEHRKDLFDASKSYDDLNLALLNSNSKFMELDNTIKSNIVSTFNKLAESKKNLNFKDFIGKIDTDVLKSYQDALNVFKTDGNVKNLTIAFDELQKSLVQTALKFTKNKETALEVANTFLKLQDPIGYAQVSLSKFQSAIQTVASATTISTKSIISAFGILGISINKEVANILSGYMGLVAGIQSVADAHNVIAKIANDVTEGGKTTGMADTSYKISLVTTPLINLGKYYDELNKLQKSINNNPSGGGGVGGGSKDKSSSSSQAAEKELYESKEYSNALSEIDKQLSILNAEKEKLDKTSTQYQDSLRKEITLLQQKQQLAHAEADDLRKRKNDKLWEINQIAGADWFSLSEEKQKSLFDSLYEPKKNEKQKYFNDLLKNYDDIVKSIDSCQSSWQDWQKTIEDTSVELEDIATQIKDLQYESYNNILEASENKLSKFHELSSEYSSEISHQISLRGQEQQSILDEISALEKLIQTEEIGTLKKQKYIDRIKTLASQYWQLERAIDDNKKSLEDLDNKKFENSFTQLERAIEPLNNKISNLASNLDLLSETNFDGKINLINQQMSANKDLVSQLEAQLRQLLSTTPKNATQAQALANAIKNTKSALFAARKETILYGKELGKLALEKIKYGFDKITNSLEQQMNVTEHLIDMMIDGIPTGIDLSFNYATDITDNTIVEDTENIAQAGIDVLDEYFADSLESQRDYNAEMIEEQKQFFTEQTQQFQSFFDNFLKMVAEMNGIHIFDTTLSDFARVKGASEETIKKLQELERKLQQLENKRVKDSKKNTDKIVDINQDGIDDITGELINGYEDNLKNTRNYFDDLIDEYGTNWDKIISLVQGKIGKIGKITPDIPSDNSGNNNSGNNNSGDNYTPTPTKTLVRTITPANFINRNGITYMQKSNFPSDVQSHIDGNTPSINEGNWYYYGIASAYRSAGYNVEWDGTNVLIYKYAKGTKGHPGGLAQISEEGRELLIYPNGSVEVSNDDGAEIRNLPKGTTVIPHKETEDILQNRSFANGTSNPNGLWRAADDKVRDGDGRVRNRDQDLYYIKYRDSYWWVDQALLGRNYFAAKDNDSFVYFGDEAPTEADIREHFGLDSVWYGSNSWSYAKSSVSNNSSSTFNINDEWFWTDTGELAGYTQPTEEETTTHSSSSSGSNSGSSGSSNNSGSSSTTAQLQSNPIPSWTGNEADLSKITKSTTNEDGVVTNTTLKDDVETFIKKNLPSAKDLDFSKIKSNELSQLFSEAITQSTSNIINAGYDSIKTNLEIEIAKQRDLVTTWTNIANKNIGEKYIDANGNEVTITQQVKEDAFQKAIDATNALITSERKLKSVLKDKYDYQFSAMEKEKDGLNDIIELEDDFKDQLELLDDNDFSGRLNLTEQLFGNAGNRKKALEYLRDMAKTQRDTFAIGSAEWIILDEKFKNYGEQLEEVEKDIKSIGTSIKQISFDSLTASFNKFIKDVNEKLDKLDFSSQFIDENDLQGKFNNLTSIITEGLSKIAILTDKIENVAINPETAEWWANLDSEQQAAKIKTWQEDLKDTILLVFNSEKTLADIPKQRLEKMSNVENEIVQMIRKRVEVEKESLDEQLRLTEENIDKRIKYINKLYDEQDYKDDLSEKEDKLKELYAERAKWSLDTSIEGQNKLKEINKQIESQEKDIAKTQRQRGKNLRIEALNDEKENAQKITEEKQKELDKQLRNDNLYAEAQRAIQTGQIEFLTIANGEVVKINGVAQTGIMDLSTAFGSFVNTYGEGLSTLGGQIKSNFIDGIVLANTEIQNLINNINSLTTIEGYKDYVKPKTPPSSVNPDMADVKPKTPPSSDIKEEKPKTVTNLGHKIIIDPQKTWTIALSQEVDSNNIPIVNITDENGNVLFKTKPELSTDGKNLIIKPPSGGYKFGQNYQLIVYGGKDKSGKDLKDITTLSFDYNRGKDVINSEDINKLIVDERTSPEKYNTPFSKLYSWLLAGNDNIIKYMNFINLPGNSNLNKIIQNPNPKSYTEFQEAALQILRGLGVSFGTGGFTGNFDGSKLAFLHEKELILNKVDTENILKTVDITRNIVNNLKPLNFNNLINGAISKQELKFNFENLINVQGSVDKDALPGLKDIADYTINKLKVELNKQGVFRGV